MDGDHRNCGYGSRVDIKECRCNQHNQFQWVYSDVITSGERNRTSYTYTGGYGPMATMPESKIMIELSPRLEHLLEKLLEKLGSHD